MSESETQIIPPKHGARVTLGESYKDMLSGVEGVATARHEYLYGCVRVTLEWGLNGELKFEAFDEQRLVELESEKPPEPTATSGGPQRSTRPRHTGPPRSR